MATGLPVLITMLSSACGSLDDGKYTSGKVKVTESENSSTEAELGSSNQEAKSVSVSNWVGDATGQQKKMLLC